MSRDTRIVMRATEYQFRPACLFEGDPRDHADLYDHRAITVEWRGGNRWAIKRFSDVWSEDAGEWEYEPQPSSRDDAFLARTRYSEGPAKAIAYRLALSDEALARARASAEQRPIGPESPA